MYCSSNTETSFDVKIHSLLEKNFNALERVTETELLKAAKSGNVKIILRAFEKTRHSYKKVELFTEYYAPSTSRLLNGPPLPEIEVEETKSFNPGGLQVIEEQLYPFAESNRPELIREIEGFLSKVKHARSIIKEIKFTEAHVLDACKLQVFRIISLGITGFDTPLSNKSIPEVKSALIGIQDAVSTINPSSKINSIIKKAELYLDANTDFNKFNRMEFIQQYANPLSKEIKLFEKEQKIQPLETELALYNKAETLFDATIFNRDFFAESVESAYTKEKVMLGKQLFSDPILSGTSRTCLSCHNPAMAFTDGLPKSSALIPGTFLKRNSPTLLYAGLQQAQFYDMRSPSLENQAMDVIANKDEMHASVEEAALRINKSSRYLSSFKKAFPTMEKEIKPRFVLIALASFIRSLDPFNSRFDQYMRGDKKQMTAQEINGFNLFMGKGKCGTCHFAPIFNGTAPPFFTSSESEVLGLTEKSESKALDPDMGRYVHTKIDELKFSFKTPTLRNVEITGPYMHNGAFQTLGQVIDFYNEGGGAGMGLSVPNQTLAAEPLNLSKKEKEAIIAFLQTLTDEDHK